MKGSLGTATTLRGGYKSRKGQLCPVCNSSDNPKGGKLRVIKSKFGKNKIFFGCDRYPECKYTANW